MGVIISKQFEVFFIMVCCTFNTVLPLSGAVRDWLQPAHTAKEKADGGAAATSCAPTPPSSSPTWMM